MIVIFPFFVAGFSSSREGVSESLPPLHTAALAAPCMTGHVAITELASTGVSSITALILQMPSESNADHSASFTEQLTNPSLFLTKLTCVCTGRKITIMTQRLRNEF